MTGPAATSQDGLPAFALLHPRIQEQLHAMRWTELRPIQVAAIREILLGDRHVLISAQTAGGKTEAAFLPIVSQLVETPCGSIGAIYISPLKALINDQFRRLDELCERAELPVHRWHGDVGQAARRELLRNPAGVLLITPESVEALFVNRPQDLPSLFGGLRYIVVDELHSFIGTERGAQLRSLVARLTAHRPDGVRLIALSATLGDVRAAGKWLAPHEQDRFAIIQAHGDKTVHYQLRGYLRPAVQLEQQDPEAEDPPVTREDDRVAADVLEAYYGKTALIFVNSRRKLEFYADLVGRKAERDGRRNLFRVHHGSLSKGEREDTEEALRSDTPAATFCSSTLELGIDVGNVKEVGQIGAPWSVSSLAQRLGRSGRRDEEPSVLRLFLEENEPSTSTPLVDRLFPQLLQAIAMTELMLERWCEPPDTGRLHLSTLVQQLLSVIAQLGGASAAMLFERLVTRGGFGNVSSRVFAGVLRSMAAADLIEQAPEGDLILGMLGERIVRSYEFYSAFQTEIEWRVVCDGRTIGTVATPPDFGAVGFLILAGRRWKIRELDIERREILVHPARGGRAPHFAGAAGADLSPRVRQRMRDVLFGREVPVYLDALAREMLAQARGVAREARLAECHLFREGETTYWFTWTGSRIQRTLLGIGQHCAGLTARDAEIALMFEGATPDEVRAAYAGLPAALPEPETLALRFPMLAQEKYDRFLSRELLALGFAQNQLDLPGALRLIAGLTRG